MSRLVPLIRAGSLMPFLGWLRNRGGGYERALRDSGLDAVAFQSPEDLLPLVSVLRFVEIVSRGENLPDLGCRVVTRGSVAALGAFGRAALSEHTVGDGLTAAAAAMRQYSNYERMTVVRGSVAADIFFSFRGRSSPLGLHIAMQYTAALVRTFCSATGWRNGIFERVEVPPHPELGVVHLKPWFGDGVKAAATQTLRLRISREVLDLPLRDSGAIGARARPANAWVGLLPGQGFAATTRILVGSMLSQGVPTVESVAAASGTTVRTLQRRLRDDGSTFSDILDDARREGALAALRTTTKPIAEIAVSLGYADLSGFCRAVHRWAGTSPTRIRASGASLPLAERSSDPTARAGSRSGGERAPQRL